MHTNNKQYYKSAITVYVILHFILGVMILWGGYEYFKAMALSVFSNSSYLLHIEGLIETTYIVIIAIWTNIGWDVLKKSYVEKSSDFIVTALHSYTFVVVAGLLSLVWLGLGAENLFKNGVNVGTMLFHLTPLIFVCAAIGVSYVLEKKQRERKNIN